MSDGRIEGFRGAVRRRRSGDVACLTTLVMLVLLGLARPASAQDVGLPLGTVPGAVELQDLDGNAVTLSEYVGKKPVIVEFWATWCPLCAELEPRIAAAKKRYGERLDVVIIAVGVNQTPRSIKRHLQDHTPPGRVLFDARGRAARAFQAPSTSYIVALDASGRVVYTGVGSEQDIGAAAAKAVAAR
jgi:thiol-disulfide isomerase/thioredoxin